MNFFFLFLGLCLLFTFKVSLQLGSTSIFIQRKFISHGLNETVNNFNTGICREILNTLCFSPESLHFKSNTGKLVGAEKNNGKLLAMMISDKNVCST